MEKDVAVREWCIQKAIEIKLHQKADITVSMTDVVQVAKQIEDYILDKKV